MQSQRKRFNYISSGVLSQQPQNRQTYQTQSSYTSSAVLREKPLADRVTKRDEDYKKQISELQALNQKIISDTAKQFEKFQSDIVDVEKILIDKEQTIAKLKEGNKRKQAEVFSLNSQANRKEQEIQDLQNHIQEVVRETEFKDSYIEEQMAQKQSKVQIIDEFCQTETISKIFTEISIQTGESYLQTFLQKQSESESRLQEENMYKNRCLEITQRAKCMQEEIYQLKEELYNATSELSMLKQEFSSYKILKEIESVQKR